MIDDSSESEARHDIVETNHGVFGLIAQILGEGTFFEDLTRFREKRQASGDMPRIFAFSSAAMTRAVIGRIDSKPHAGETCIVHAHGRRMRGAWTRLFSTMLTQELGQEDL